MSVCNLSFSPIKGPEGNIEYLVHLKKEALTSINEGVDAKDIVQKSHASLDK